MNMDDNSYVTQNCMRSGGHRCYDTREDVVSTLYYKTLCFSKGKERVVV